LEIELELVNSAVRKTRVSTRTSRSFQIDT
jgi:hypothetical protein